MQHLDDLALFVNVVRAKGFSQTAKQLNIPLSTLSTRIKRLEKALGFTLLNRSTRYFELTEVGNRYFERISPLIDEMIYTQQDIHQQFNQISGTLRIAATVDTAFLLIAPYYRQFIEQYPLLNVELEITTNEIDVMDVGQDVIIKMGNLPDSSLISRLLFESSCYFYASPDYLAQQGTPTDLTTLEYHQCLWLKPLYPYCWTVFSGKKEHKVHINHPILTNSSGMIARLAAEGLGVALLPELICRSYVEKAELKPILTDWHSKPIPVYAITTTRLLPAKTKCFINFLVEKLKG